MSLTICKAQLATATLQTIGNRTTTAILNKIDTTTKVFIKQYTLTSLTYTGVCAPVIGALNINTDFSISLGSQYWSIESLVLVDKGASYGASVGFFIIKDSCSGTNNVPLTWTLARISRIHSYHAQTQPINMSGSVGRITQYYTGATSGNTISDVVTGNIVVFPVWLASTWACSTQVLEIRIRFRKIKN